MREAVASEKNDFIEYLISRMTIEERIGQLFMLYIRGTTVTQCTLDLLESIPVGGIILFADNVSSFYQVQSLTRDLQELAEIPLFISTDEEGGVVSRVGRLFEHGITPAAFQIGLGDVPLIWRGLTFEERMTMGYSHHFTDGQHSAYLVGRYIGRHLGEMGININFAPVADVWSNPYNRVIGSRAFARTAEEVAPLVTATVEGLIAENIIATLKHFPGHGDTYEDSHFQLAFNRGDRERFAEVEVLPFISGINAGAQAVMIGHISTPQVSGHTELLCWMAPWIQSGRLPATFSDLWLQEILRSEMGFEGLIITDALNMNALTNHFTCEQIALGAFLAGADILLMPSNPQEAYRALIDGFNNEYFDEERLNDSVRRILSSKLPLFEQVTSQ